MSKKSEPTNSLFIGSPRGCVCSKTLQVIIGKLHKIGKFGGERLLDVGCGDGSFTIALAEGRFREIHGIDVQEPYLQKFRDQTKDNPAYHIHNMSASSMDFPSGYFDCVVSIETLEHIPDLQKGSAEIARILRAGGEFLLTVPNRWFPFENHGIRLFGKEFHGRVPFITYLPLVHQKIALARVFTVAGLDRLFCPLNLKRTNLDYAWPTFEHGGNRYQPLLRWLYPLMRFLESSPVKMFGTSIVARYEKAKNGSICGPDRF